MHLEELLQMLYSQIDFNHLGVEIIIVDSGSTDKTLDIATKYKCNILKINKKDFTFGKSLNLGCEAAKGDFLLFISGHCVPVGSDWVKCLIEPLVNKKADYVYSRQLPGPKTKYSERKIFEKYFPLSSKLSLTDYYCNNANSAIRKAVWEKYKFNEEITGLEDMEMAKRIFDDGGVITYTSTAPVFHYHYETFKKVRIRFERESLALRNIMPQVHFSFIDLIRYVCVSIYLDLKSSFGEGVFCENFFEVIKYRSNQYYGTYLGNKAHRNISNQDKEKYFYPS